MVFLRQICVGSAVPFSRLSFRNDATLGAPLLHASGRGAPPTDFAQPSGQPDGAGNAVWGTSFLLLTCDSITVVIQVKRIPVGIDAEGASDLVAGGYSFWAPRGDLPSRHSRCRWGVEQVDE